MSQMVVSLGAEARYDMSISPKLVQWKNITKILTRHALHPFKHMETCSGLNQVATGMLVYKVQLCT